MGNTKRSLEDVIQAIKGSDGIKVTIGQRLGVCRQTVTAYLDRWATARDAYEQEKGGTLDIAESLIIRNIKLAYKLQGKTQKPVDTKDAQWYLTMKGRERGYVKTQAQEQTGVLSIEYVNDWRNSGDDSTT